MRLPSIRLATIVTSRAEQYRRLARDFHGMARSFPPGEWRSGLLKLAEEWRSLPSMGPESETGTRYVVFSGWGTQCRKNQQHAATKENDKGGPHSNQKEGPHISVSNKTNGEPTADAEQRADKECREQNNAHARKRLN